MQAFCGGGELLRSSSKLLKFYSTGKNLVESNNPNGQTQLSKIITAKSILEHLMYCT